jgi:arylsulfatase A-like enzyme
MICRSTLIRWAFALFLLAGAMTAPALNAAPNIVFVLVDDLRWDDLGCAGNDFVQTPNIDRSAREGVQFQNAFATTPLCSPSRGSILTGQFAHLHGITDNTERGEQSHRLKTFPQVLHQAGYETAYLGKWHMGNDNTRRPGFDRWFCLTGQGTSFDPLVNDDGKEVQRTGYVTDVLNEESVKFIKQKHDKPFLLFLPHSLLAPECPRKSRRIRDCGRRRHAGLAMGNKVFRHAPPFRTDLHHLVR